MSITLLSWQKKWIKVSYNKVIGSESQRTHHLYLVYNYNTNKVHIAIIHIYQVMTEQHSHLVWTPQGTFLVDIRQYDTSINVYLGAHSEFYG